MSDEVEVDEISGSHSFLVKCGLGITGGYALLIVIYVAWRINEIASLPANEFGDLLAGVFAPLAFGWLVLGFFQQGHELQASTTALRLQAAELKNSVTQQQELVSVTREQMEAERERARIAELESSRLAQPVFMITGHMSYSDSSTCRLTAYSTSQWSTREPLAVTYE